MKKQKADVKSNLIPGAPKRPGGLSPRATVEWDRLLLEMQESGIVLVPAYRALLTQAATLCADFYAAWQSIQKDGRYTVNKRSGVMKLNPAIDDMNKTRGQLLRVLWQLGLTPRAQNMPTEETHKGATLADILSGRAEPAI